eukprot:14010403-Alexandrium_andersonii.AAC.1
MAQNAHLQSCEESIWRPFRGRAVQAASASSNVAVHLKTQTYNTFWAWTSAFWAANLRTSNGAPCAHNAPSRGRVREAVQSGCTIALSQ